MVSIALEGYSPHQFSPCLSEALGVSGLTAWSLLMTETFCCRKHWAVVTRGCSQQSLLLSGGCLRGHILWAELPARWTCSPRATAALVVINKRSNLMLKFHCKNSPSLLPCLSQRRRWLLAKQLFQDMFFRQVPMDLFSEEGRRGNARGSRSC